MTTDTAEQGSSLNTHGYRLTNSQKHRGELITRVPLSYLRWMVQVNHTEAAWAEAELERRGAILPELDVSSHAVDKASLRVRKLWHETRGAEEGLYTWLARVTAAALKHGTRLESGKVQFAGMKLKIAADGRWPVLVSVMPGARSIRRCVELAVQDLGAGDVASTPRKGVAE